MRDTVVIIIFFILLASSFFFWYEASRPPFTYELDNVPDTVCAGGNLEYTVRLSVTDTPITLFVTRTWVDAKGDTVVIEERLVNYTRPTQKVLMLSLPVPSALGNGPAELRVVGSARNKESDGYDIFFEVISCD